MSKTKLYQRIANELKQQISQGAYMPGNKLPSIRSLARQKQVSISSIQKALEELEASGLIQAKPKSGFFVRSRIDSSNSYQAPMITSLPKPVKIHEFASKVFHECEDSRHNLAIGYPHMAYGPHQQLQKIAAKIVRQQMPELLEVHFSEGNLSLRNILAKRIKESGCLLSGNDLIITNGCLEALSVCLRAIVKPGDTVAVESPGFIGLFQVLESLGCNALEIPCNTTEGISIEALQLAIEQWPVKAVVVISSFSNPLGTRMPEANRKALVDMLAEHNLPLVENDLLAELSFDGSRLKPCKAFDKKGLVLYCSSASKTIASGLRIGWTAPGAFFKEVSYFKTFTNINVASFAQLVIAEFIKSGKYDRHLRHLSSLLSKRMYALQQLIQQYFPADTKISYPGGGSILWIGLPNKIDGYVFFKRALTKGIAVIPGQLSSSSNKFNHCIRINCACDPKIDLEKVIKTLANLAFEIINS